LAVFSNGEKTISVPKFRALTDYELEAVQNFSGPFPVNGDDVFFEDLKKESGKIVEAGVQSSPLWLLALIPLAFLVYRRVKHEKT
jgi:hypothetical protein